MHVVGAGRYPAELGLYVDMSQPSTGQGSRENVVSAAGGWLPGVISVRQLAAWHVCPGMATTS
jgi:hypothetical protein